MSQLRGVMERTGSNFVKNILQDSGTLKQVAWGLDVGTGRDRTSIKTEFSISLPLSLFYLLSFIFCFVKFFLELSFE